jgi:hypothetical protein
MPRISETQLYAPVKAYLEGLGYAVKAEIADADVVAYREGEEPLVVELKTGFSLTLLQQAVARQAISDVVYVAVPRWSGRPGWQRFKGNIGLCKRLGIGVLSVRLKDGAVQVHADPVPFQPRKSKVRRARLLREFERRVGDPNTGGTAGSIVTAYQQDAERCAEYLLRTGPSKGAVVAREANAPRATRMMADNHYGWFERVSKGIYQLTAIGRAVTEKRIQEPS